MRSSLVRCLFTGLLFLHAGASGAQTASETLLKLCDEYWQGELRADPVTATSLGDRRYDALLDDITPEGRQREHDRLTSLRERSVALPERDLSAPDRVNSSALLDVLDGEITTLDCDFTSWVVDPLDGPQVRFPNIPSQQPVRTPEEGRAMGPWLDTHMANLRRRPEGGTRRDA